MEWDRFVMVLWLEMLEDGDVLWVIPTKRKEDAARDFVPSSDEEAKDATADFINGNWSPAVPVIPRVPTVAGPDTESKGVGTW